MINTKNMPAEVFPPGDFIREELEERDWTQEDLATILGRSIRLVNERADENIYSGVGSKIHQAASIFLV